MNVGGLQLKINNRENSSLSRKKLTQILFLAILLPCLIFSIKPLAAKETVTALPFSTEELAAFDEAPNLFPIKKLPSIANIQIKEDPILANGRRLVWKSANEVFLGVNQYEQWRAGKNELKKIVVFNIDTNQVELTPYRGNLICFKPERMLVCQNPIVSCSKMETQKGMQTGTPFLTGAWGETLRPMSKEMHEGLDHETCELYAPDAYIGKKVDGISIGSHLGPNAGYVGYGDWSIKGQKYALLNNEGNIYWQTELHSGCEHIYNKTLNVWDGSYFIGSGFASGNAQSSGTCSTQYKHRVFLVQPNKTAREIELPELFGRWLKEHIAGVSVTWTRRGLLFFNSSDPIRQGLYWANEQGRIKRLIAGRYMRTVKVAPDGCKVFVQHYDGIGSYTFATPAERQKIERTFETNVIDMCQGELN